MEATRQLDRAIKQLPKEGSIDELAAIELLCKVLLGKNKDPLPINNVQKQRERKRAQPAPRKIMPPELVEKYNLKELEVDGWV